MMTPNDITLKDEDRKKLDGIVMQMAKKGASKEEVQSVVSDFKNKYGVVKKKGDTQPIQEESTESVSISESGDSSLGSQSVDPSSPDYQFQWSGVDQPTEEQLSVVQEPREVPDTAFGKALAKTKGVEDLRGQDFSDIPDIATQYRDKVLQEESEGVFEGDTEMEKGMDDLTKSLFPSLAKDDTFLSAMRAKYGTDPEFANKASQGDLSKEDKFNIANDFLVEKTDVVADEIEEIVAQPEMDKQQLFTAFNEYKTTLSLRDNLLSDNKDIVDRYESYFKTVEERGDSYLSDLGSRTLNSLNNFAVDLLSLPATGAALLEEAVGRGDEYTIADKLLELSDSYFKDALPTSERQFYQEGGDLDWAAIPLQTADQIGLFAGLAVGNYYGNLRAANALRQTKNISVSPQMLMQNQQNLYSVGGGYVASLEEYRKSAKEMGLKGVEVVSYVNFMALIEGMSEMVMPNNKIFSPEIRDITTKTFVKNLSKGKKFAINEAMKTLGENIGKENFEELMVMLGETGVTASLSLDNENVDVAVPTLEDVINTVASTSLLVGGSSTLGVAKIPKQLRSESFIKGAENVEGTRALVDEYIKKGVVTEEDGKQYIANVEAAAQAMPEIPNDVSIETKAKLLPLAVEIQEQRVAAENKKGSAKKIAEETIAKLEAESIELISKDKNLKQEEKQAVEEVKKQQEGETVVAEGEAAIQELEKVAKGEPTETQQKEGKQDAIQERETEEIPVGERAADSKKVDEEVREQPTEERIEKEVEIDESKKESQPESVDIAVSEEGAQERVEEEADIQESLGKSEEGVRTQPESEVEEVTEAREEEARPLESDTEGSPSQQIANSIGKSTDISDVLEGATKSRVGSTDVILTDTQDGIVIESIETKPSQRGKGGARRALQKVVNEADKRGVPITLKIEPKDKGTTKEGLTQFYESMGFEVSNGTAVRQPQNIYESSDGKYVVRETKDGLEVQNTQTGKITTTSNANKVIQEAISANSEVLVAGKNRVDPRDYERGAIELLKNNPPDNAVDLAQAIFLSESEGLQTAIEEFDYADIPIERLMVGALTKQSINAEDGMKEVGSNHFRGNEGEKKKRNWFGNNKEEQSNGVSLQAWVEKFAEDNLDHPSVNWNDLSNLRDALIEIIQDYNGKQEYNQRNKEINYIEEAKLLFKEMTGVPYTDDMGVASIQTVTEDVIEEADKLDIAFVSEVESREYLPTQAELNEYDKILGDEQRKKEQEVSSNIESKSRETEKSKSVFENESTVGKELESTQETDGEQQLQEAEQVEQADEQVQSEQREQEVEEQSDVEEVEEVDEFQEDLDSILGEEFGDEEYVKETVSQSYVDRVYALFSPMFDGLEVFNNLATFKARLKEEGYPSDYAAKGFVGTDGNIYLNPELMTADTPIHEFGHVWMGLLRTSNPRLYQKGVELIENSPYLKRALESGYMNPDIAREEALAQAIGEKGAEVLQKNDFVEWLNEVYDYIKNLLNIETANSIEDMTLEDFTNMAIVDMIKANGELTNVTVNGVEKVNSGVKFQVDATTTAGDMVSNPLVTFYSNAEKGLENLNLQPSKPDVWVKKIIEAGGRGTKQELDWIGLEDYLNEWMQENNAKSVSKEVIEKYIQDNKIEVVEVSKGDGFVVTDIENDKQIREFNNYEDAVDFVNEQRKTGNDYSILEKTKGGSVKYEQYTLEGGENYREVLLTLPQEKSASSYKSSHWDESNIVAHLRINERALPNGERVMFIEEVQSDWAQEGKKKGFREPIKGEKFNTENTYIEKDGGIIRLKDKENDLVQADAFELNFENKSDSYIQEFLLNRANGYAERNYGFQTVPNMPYKKTDQWVGMAMRRAFKMASDEGFDRVAWVTGEQSAERYDLSKQVDSIEVFKDGDNYGIQAAKGGRLVTEQNGLSAQKLEETVGKELASKAIVDLETKDVAVYEGQDLSVGGEGMKAFYNSILPKVAKKEAQRFDKKANVQVVDFRGRSERETAEALGDDALPPSLDRATQQLSIPITPKMNTVLTDGVPLFQLDNDPRTSKAKSAINKTIDRGIPRERAVQAISSRSGLDETAVNALYDQVLVERENPVENGLSEEETAQFRKKSYLRGLLESPNLDPEALRFLLKIDPFYKVETNEWANQDADKILAIYEKAGRMDILLDMLLTKTEGARGATKNVNPNVAGGTQAMLLIKVADWYIRNGQYSIGAQVYREIDERGRTAGRFLQALRDSITPETVNRRFQASVKAMQEQVEQDPSYKEDYERLLAEFQELKQRMSDLLDEKVSAENLSAQQQKKIDSLNKKIEDLQKGEAKIVQDEQGGRRMNVSTSQYRKGGQERNGAKKRLKKSLQGLNFSDLKFQISPEEQAKQVREELNTIVNSYIKQGYFDMDTILEMTIADVKEATGMDISKQQLIEAVGGLQYRIQEAVAKKLRKSDEDFNIRIKRMLKSAFDSAMQTRKQIIENMVNSEDLSQEEAAQLYDLAFDTFNELLKQKAGLSPSDKTLVGKLKNGSLSEGRFRDEMLKRHGAIVISEEQNEKIYGMIRDMRVYLNSPKMNQRALNEFQTYLRSIESIPVRVKLIELASDMFYSNILSGMSTIKRGAFGVGMTMIAEVVIEAIKRPQHTFRSFEGMKALITGANRGRVTAWQYMKDGVNTLDPLDERNNRQSQLNKIISGSPRDYFREGRFDKNIIQAVSFMPVMMVRGLVAIDAMAHYAGQEYFEYVATANQILGGTGTLKDRKYSEFLNEVREKMGNTEAQEREAKKQAEKEYAEALKNEYMAPNSNFVKERTAEIIQESRDAITRAWAYRRASEGRLGHDPIGLMGGIYSTIVSGHKNIAFLDRFVPFIRIPTNAMNMWLDYTPWGFARATSIKLSGLSVHDYLLQEKLRQTGRIETVTRDKGDATNLYIKAALGSLVWTMLYAGLNPDDEEDAWIDITADGYGKFSENQTLSSGDDWKPYAFRFKNPITGDWSKWYDYRDSPIGLVLSSLGYISDAKKYKEEGEIKSEASYLGSAFMNSLLFVKEQNYVQALIDLTDLFSKQSSESSTTDHIYNEATKIAARQIRASVYPNIYKQTYETIKSAYGGEDMYPAKASEVGVLQSLYENVVKDVPLLEDTIERQRVDVLGFVHVEPLRKSQFIPERFIPEVALETIDNAALDMAEIIREKRKNEIWKVIYDKKAEFYYPRVEPRYKGVKLTTKQREDAKSMILSRFNEWIVGVYNNDWVVGRKNIKDLSNTDFQAYIDRKQKQIKKEVLREMF